MNKKIFLSATVSMFLASSMFAENIGGENLIIEKNSETAQKLIKNETDYKAYLHKKGDLVRFDKKRADQLQENSCDINKLKTAVAMLIERIEKLETEGVTTSVENAQVPVASDETVNSISDIASKKDSIDNVVAPEQESVTVCKKKKVLPSWSVESIKFSFIKYPKYKNFMAANDSEQFQYPMIDSLTDGLVPLKRGERFQADMWTKAGWVHNINGGWVKGYMLSPPVYQIKTNDQKTKHAFEWKEECTTVPVTK